MAIISTSLVHLCHLATNVVRLEKRIKGGINLEYHGLHFPLQCLNSLSNAAKGMVGWVFRVVVGVGSSYTMWVGKYVVCVFGAASVLRLQDYEVVFGVFFRDERIK